MNDKEKFEKGEVPDGASRLPWLVLIIIIIISLGSFWWVKRASSPGANLSSDKFQAVFLSNGQTYYGKLRDFESKHPYLTEVFYLTLQPQAQVEQQFDEEGNPLPTPTLGPQNYQILALVADLHGPEDKIVFNKESILFVEELREDSQVLQAIRNIQAQVEGGGQ